MKPIKLKAYAKSIGIEYRTALRLFHDGTLGIEAKQSRDGKAVYVYPPSYSVARSMVGMLPREEQMKLATEILNTGGLE